MVKQSFKGENTFKKNFQTSKIGVLDKIAQSGVDRVGIAQLQGWSKQPGFPSWRAALRLHTSVHKIRLTPS